MVEREAEPVYSLDSFKFYFSWWVILNAYFITSSPHIN